MARWSQKVPPTPSKFKERRPREESKDFEGSQQSTGPQSETFSLWTRWHPAACTSRNTDGLEAASALTAAVWLVSGDASCVSSLLPMEQRPNPWPGMLASYLHTHTLRFTKTSLGHTHCFPTSGLFCSCSLLVTSSYVPVLLASSRQKPDGIGLSSHRTTDTS